MDAYEFDVGPYTWKTSTSSPSAQRWFDRGFMWALAFNHVEALHCFESAVKEDPDFAMGHWAVAYANGPNYNVNEVSLDMWPSAPARESTDRALALVEKGGVSEWEAALIRALDARNEMPYTPMSDQRARLDHAYTDAMKKVYEQYGDDPNIAALYAESVMELTPWQMYDFATSTPKEHTAHVIEVLEKAMERTPDHAGLCHFYVHVIEMSADPSTALPAAEHLRKSIMPAAGHLKHMATHIDVLLGDYTRVIDSNWDAFALEEKFFAARGKFNFQCIYAAHNLHFISYAAMFQGNYAHAIRAGDEQWSLIDTQMLHVDFFAMFVEHFLGVRYHVLARFGKWEKILEEELVEDPQHHQYSYATQRYVRGLALAALQRIDEAEKEHELFKKAVANVPESRLVFRNPASSVLNIADTMLRGEIAYRKGEYDKAFELLTEAVKLDDNLLYDEPWGWMVPARHALGALLLEQSHVERAEDVFRHDLQLGAKGKGHPNNVWSLRGLVTCLERKSGADADGARAERERLLREMAKLGADTDVKAPCFCATHLIAAS